MRRSRTTIATIGGLERPGLAPDLGAPRPRVGRSAALVIAVLAILVVVAM
jgi:hypothetical protein